jgi:hypothetical protein
MKREDAICERSERRDRTSLTGRTKDRVDGLASSEGILDEPDVAGGGSRVETEARN